MVLVLIGPCSLTPDGNVSDLTAYLWPIGRENIKTAIENHQRLVVEGCYIPFDYRSSFESRYLEQIQFVCLCFSQAYLAEHFDVIQSYANVVEQRLDDSGCTKEQLQRENEEHLRLCQQYSCPYILSEYPYHIDRDAL